MTVGLTDNQRADILLNRLNQAYDRNHELSSYIRITDGAIWGFLGFAAIELFRESFGPFSHCIPFFLILVIISMILWRKTVNRYHNDIMDGYEEIEYYESLLQISDYYSLKHKKDRKMADQKLNGFAYVDITHIDLDNYAEFIWVYACILLIVWFTVLFCLLGQLPICL